MSESFTCGDTGALVAYIYEECEPALRTRIAAHVARCHSCANEVDGLGGTRQQLGAWTPPVPELGFQMPVPSPAPAVAWWRAPLPAWAQAAAAVLIFAAGLSVGLTRGAGGSPDAAVAEQPAAAPVALVSPADLSQLEQRLRAEMAGVRTAAPSQTAAPDAALIQRVRGLIDESEERQRREFTLRSVELARDLEAQRRLDLATMRETVGQLQGVTGAEVRQQREAIDRINNYLIRVSQQGR